MLPIKKGDIVKIKKQWQDPGDDAFIWTAISDEEKGRVDISPNLNGLSVKPITTVLVSMLEGHN